LRLDEWLFDTNTTPPDSIIQYYNKHTNSDYTSRREKVARERQSRML
jgi:hypothetical protein